jgi:hypothetical protein
MLRKIVPLLLLLASFFNADSALAQDDWEFAAAVYGWLPDIDIKLEDGTNVEITIDDILDNLDFTAMFGGEARKGKWSLASDMVYLGLSNKPKQSLGESLTLHKIAMESWVVTPTVGYMVLDSGNALMEVVAGARYVWLKQEVTIDTEAPASAAAGREKTKVTGSNWDGIVGVRGNYRLSERWRLPYAFNIGTGQSDSTFQAMLAAAYQFNCFDAVAGWRYLTWDDDKTISDLTINGPYVGVLWRF